MRIQPVVAGAAVIAALALGGCDSGTDPGPSPTATTPTPPAPSPTPTVHTSTLGVQMTVTAPLANAVVTSPLSVAGSVSGTWMFEANFGVKLLDANRKLIVQSHATAEGDWMTSDPVPFSATLTFTAPASDTGVLVLENANASGDPAKADSVEIPVRFR
jgi:hypothetical protein